VYFYPEKFFNAEKLRVTALKEYTKERNVLFASYYNTQDLKG